MESFNPLLNVLHRRQLLNEFLRQIAGNLVFAYTHGFAHVFQRVFSHQRIFALAQQQTNRRLIILLFENRIDR